MYWNRGIRSAATSRGDDVMDFHQSISVFPRVDRSGWMGRLLGVKSFIAAAALLLALIMSSHAVAWTASEDKAGQLNVVGVSGEGELRIVIKGKDVKVFTLLKSLERDNAPSFDVATVLGPKKAKSKWAASTDPAQPGALLQAPNGTALLDEFFQAGASTFSVRVAPAGKLSVVADFSLSGLELHKARIQEAQTKVPGPATAAIKPGNSR